jgi:hypothetical protein
MAARAQMNARRALQQIPRLTREQVRVAGAESDDEYHSALTKFLIDLPCWMPVRG